MSSEDMHVKTLATNVCFWLSWRMIAFLASRPRVVASFQAFELIHSRPHWLVPNLTARVDKLSGSKVMEKTDYPCWSCA